MVDPPRRASLVRSRLDSVAVDSYLSELLSGFLDGLEEPTLIVFTSDHGEALGEHGELTHGLFAYESRANVLLC